MSHPTPHGLRRLMVQLEATATPELARAFYELLLALPVHVPLAADGPAFVHGPGGQVALPLYLDADTLARCSGGVAPEHVVTVQAAAKIARARPGAWMVLDMGASPGGQPIARAGVELLAQGTYPGAEVDRIAWAVVDALDAMAGGGPLDEPARALLSRARLSALGSTSGAPVAPGVHVVETTTMITIRGNDGLTYVPLWPTLAGTFSFAPDAPARVTLPLAAAARIALRDGTPLVIDPYGRSVVLGPTVLERLVDAC